MRNQMGKDRLLVKVIVAGKETVTEALLKPNRLSTVLQRAFTLGKSKKDDIRVKHDEIIKTHLIVNVGSDISVKLVDQGSGSLMRIT